MYRRDHCTYDIGMAHAVGMQRLMLQDTATRAWEGSSDRPISTTLWYPTDSSATERGVGHPAKRTLFVGGRAARDAAPAEGPRRPLVLLSHGTGGSAFQMMWLGRALAAQGYFVAAPNHHGNTAAEPQMDPRGFRMPWLRCRDLTVLLDEILGRPEWASLIDRDRVAAAGFSLGGYTVLGLAGARFSLALLQEFCDGPERDATCEPQREFPNAERDFARMLAADPGLRAQLTDHGKSFRDERVRTVVAIAPALGYALTPESLSAVSAPVLVVCGDRDKVAPPRTNAERIVGRVPACKLEILPGAGHYSFLNECSLRGRFLVPVCREPRMKRRRIHAAAANLVLRHLAETLR